MKILHLIDSGGLYGAEMMLVSLAEQQQRMGAEVVLGSIRAPELPEKPLEREARSRGVAVETFEMKPGLNLAGAWRILRYAWRHKVDLIHSHGYKTNILLGFLPKRVRRAPMVTTLHGWTATGGWTKMRVNELLDSIALRFVDRIVLVNQGMLDREDVQALPQKKIRVINNGIDIPPREVAVDSREYPEGSIEKEVVAFCGKGKVIVSVGRLSVEKGYPNLIQAVAALRNGYGQDVRLLLIGDGRLRTALEEQAEKAGLREFFMITGYLKNARDFMPLADIYAISSLTEGLPITLLEAMDSGIPVLATRVGGIPYVVQHEREALLVSPQDPAAMARAVLTLINNPDRAQTLADNAKAKVSREYSSSGMASRYLALYDEIF
jgi:glycosyltransferase involved in cell wall biosynthesis